MSALTGLTILVTRPEKQGTRLCEMITSEGGRAIACPTLAIEPLKTRTTKQKLQQLDSADLIIFLSANAVRMSANDLPKLSNQRIIIAIGPATAKALQALSLKPIVPLSPPFTSENLLRLRQLHDITDKRVAVVAGQKGRTLLLKELRKQGARVIKLSVYRRTRPSIDASALIPSFQTANLRVIICTSNESLQNLVDLIPNQYRDWLLNRQLLVVSARAVKLAKALGFHYHPIVADTASDEELLQTLIAWYNTHPI